VARVKKEGVVKTIGRRRTDMRTAERGKPCVVGQGCYWSTSQGNFLKRGFEVGWTDVTGEKNGWPSLREKKPGNLVVNSAGGGAFVKREGEVYVGVGDGRRRGHGTGFSGYYHQYRVQKNNWGAKLAVCTRKGERGPLAEDFFERSRRLGLGREENGQRRECSGKRRR